MWINSIYIFQHNSVLWMFCCNCYTFVICTTVSFLVRVLCIVWFFCKCDEKGASKIEWHMKDALWSTCCSILGGLLQMHLPKNCTIHSGLTRKLSVCVLFVMVCSIEPVQVNLVSVSTKAVLCKYMLHCWHLVYWTNFSDWILLSNTYSVSHLNT